MENKNDIKPPVDRRLLDRLVLPLSFGSLFCGIGGFDLGFERAGMICKWQVEIDQYANGVLARHWPTVRRWPDVRTWPQPDTERVDVICGGFPCQDISFAGRGAGLDGERSGLFFEAVRVVRQLRPPIVVLENVAALLVRGMDRVLGTLAEIGYDAEWHCIPAAAVGAPHRRDRVFIVANASSLRFAAVQDRPQANRQQQAARQRWLQQSLRDARWISEPDVRRVDDGIPDRVDRLRCLGNAIVPQVAEWIGRRIVEAVDMVS